MDDATEGLQAIGSWSGEFNATSNNIASYIAAAMLGVSLILVVWALAMGKDNAKTYLIAWLVALVFVISFVLR